MRFAAASLVFALLAGCAAAPPQPAFENLVPGHYKPPPRGATVLLLPAPAGVGTTMNKGFAQLEAQLQRQLTAAGYRVTLMPAADFQREWQPRLDAAGGRFNANTGQLNVMADFLALSGLAEAACAGARCQLLLRPALATRVAKVGGAVAEWDGVAQRVRFKHGGANDYRLSGTAPALSVELMAILADGRLGFRGLAGVTLTHEPDMREGSMALRADLFADESEMAEAVRIALQPLIAKPSP